MGNWCTYQPLSSKYTWPKAVQPSTSDWNTWDLALATVFQAGCNLQLPHPLSNYFQLGTHGWYFDPMECALWFASKHDWQQHGFIPLRLLTMTFHCQGEASVPTNTLQWATVQVHETKIILMGCRKIETQVQPLEGITSLQQHHFGHEWQWELMVISNLQDLVADIRAGHGYTVSDGLFQVGKGAAAWIIEGHTNKNRIIRMCFSLSADDSHSSFRSKLASLYAALFTLSSFCKLTANQQTFRLACDGKLVL